MVHGKVSFRHSRTKPWGVGSLGVEVRKTLLRVEVRKTSVRVEVKMAILTPLPGQCGVSHW